MANRIKISFPNQPSDFYLMAFSVYNTSLGYSQLISKTFIPGVPASTFHVQIGSTLTDTLNNLIANLNLYNVDGNATFGLGTSGDFFINFSVPADYSYTVFTAPETTITSFETEEVGASVNDALPALDIEHFQILIFDTYDNNRSLIVQKAAKSACKINWDGGDDLYKNIMASNLVFNMLVSNYEDAHFIHLFTGDEQRYRVELNAIDLSGNVQLVWRGFLLPDQYNEPYKNGALFVDFTASDMISSLKGKYFDPWYYNNRLPIAEVIALALKYTGLYQNLIVKPVLIPDSPLISWHHINVDLRAFVVNDKNKDCYSILESILKSQGLTLYSFRGLWWLEGCSRKHEKTVTALQFDFNGKRIVDIDLDKKEIPALMQSNAPVLTAVTPWCSVNFGFKVNGTKNLFSERVVRIQKSEQYYSYYRSPGFNGVPDIAPEFYGVVKLNKWIENLAGEFRLPISYTGDSLGSENYSLLFWQRVNPMIDYNYNEASVLNRYIECPETPYVKPGILYEFELQFTIPGLRVYLSENLFKEKLNDGYYDRLAPFQIFVGGVEKFSNRPSFVNNVNLRYEIEDSDDGNGLYKLVFKLKFNFNTDVEGQLKFRVLMPINMRSSGGLNDIDFLNGFVDIMKLTAIEGYDENEDIKAVRNINYTQELDYDLDLSCTIDKSVLNSFGLGFPIDPNYFQTIGRTLNNADITTHHYFAPNVDLNLVYNKWDVPASLIELLFGQGVVKSVFLENTAGERTSFNDLWYFMNATYSKLGYLKSYTGFPVIPKKYKAYPGVISSDILKYMYVKYITENFADRLNWKLAGSSVVDSYPKTLARALHGVQPEQLFRMDGVQLGLLFPNDLLSFYFDNEDRDFIPTRLTIDLFGSKSSFTAMEAKFIDLTTDISYE